MVEAEIVTPTQMPPMPRMPFDPAELMSKIMESEMAQAFQEKEENKDAQLRATLRHLHEDLNQIKGVLHLTLCKTK
jgi:hypothetical protein